MGITDEAHCQLLDSTEKEQNAMSLSWNSIVSRVFTQAVLTRPQLTRTL
jgi:hypothetical protein